MGAPGFWDNQESARATIEDANRLKRWIEPWDELAARSQEADGADLPVHSSN